MYTVINMWHPSLGLLDMVSCSPVHTSQRKYETSLEAIQEQACP